MGLITPMDWGTKVLHVTWHGQNKIPFPPPGTLWLESVGYVL